MTKKPALGRGLSALLPARAPAPPAAEPQPDLSGPIQDLPLEQIQLNPNQPRREFREAQLQELAASIRNDGIIQPLVVRRFENGFQLVAGERRLRAAKIAGLTNVPVVVKEVSGEKLLEIALVENIQREDLNPIELAQAFERLSTGLGLNHEEIGRRTGKDRATITNAIRLLQLPADLQDLVAARKLSPGHARALLKLRTEEEQRNLALRAVAEGWTVRAIETASQQPTSPPRPARDPVVLRADPNIQAAAEALERVLGSRVKITTAESGKGRIEIEYYSMDDLHRIYVTITGEN